LVRECKPNHLLPDSAALLALHPLVEKECKYNVLHLSLVHGVIKKNDLRFKDVPLSNIDLRKWCSYLRIPIKGIFSRDETKPLHHSSCIINLDDFGSLGTHWVCCWQTNGNYEYFDSFGLPPNVRDAESLDIFKRQLKTVLFKCAFLN